MGVITWEWWLLLGTSHSTGDFTAFYSIGHYLVRHRLGLLPHLYAYHIQVAAERLYGLVPRGGTLTLPFVNPPTAVSPFLPLAIFAQGQAYVIWDVATFTGFAAALIWLAGTWRLLTPRGVIVLACLASFPALINLAEGDLDFLVAIGMVAVVQARQRSWRAGGPIGAALVSMKPQTLLLWVVPALRTVRLRVVREVLGTLAFLAVASAAVFGPVGVRQMVARVISVPEQPREHVTLLGLLDTLLGKGPWAGALAVAAFGILALGLWLMWSRYPPESELECGYMAAAVTCASLAAAPYDLLQGLVVLAVPAVFVASVRQSRGTSLLPVLAAVAAVSACALAGFAGYIPLPATAACLLVLAATSAAAWRREALARG